MIYFSCFDKNIQNLNFIIRTKNVKLAEVYKLTPHQTVIDLIKIPNGKKFLYIAVKSCLPNSDFGCTDELTNLTFYFEITNYDPKKEE